MAVNVYYVGVFCLLCLFFLCTMKAMSKKMRWGWDVGLVFLLNYLEWLKDCPEELHGCGIHSEVLVWTRRDQGMEI